MRKIAIFDIDGTIFRSSLLIELTEILVREKIFPAKIKKVYGRAYQKWLNRQGPYENYIRAVVQAFEQSVKGARRDIFLKVVKQAVDFHKDRIYRYTRDLIKDLKRKNYYLLAISNSPKMVLDEFCRKRGFDKVYGRIYKIAAGRFTGETEYLDLISDKAKILKRAVAKENLTLKGSIGIGDTESDIRFLSLVEKPICFNPNQKLYQYAKRRGWQVVVERKDVIYRL